MTYIFHGHRSDQFANINVRGDNDKINVNQQSNNQVGDTSGHGALPECVILCFNPDVRIK